MQRVLVAAALLLVCPPAQSARAADEPSPLDLVAVAIVDDGRAILLATPGLHHKGRVWRFRSLDTSDVPQPIREVVLAASGTKLLLQTSGEPGGVLDLTRQQRHNAPLQHVSPTDLASAGVIRGQSHHLPGQLFVSILDSTARVIDDNGEIQQDYPALAALSAAISADGAVFYVRADGRTMVCEGRLSDRGECRDLPTRLEIPVTISARSVPGSSRSPRFVVLQAGEKETRIVEAETGTTIASSSRPAEAALRAALLLNGMSMRDDEAASLVDSLVKESAGTWAAGGRRITDWRFFVVTADEELYAPVLQFAPSETVFPSTFGALEELSPGAASHDGESPVDMLYDRYLRSSTADRRNACTVYFRTHTEPGAWEIEYWLYYPFDVGGLGSHAHDPEHFFVQVDKLGGSPRKVIGAGHGYMAGNNVFTAEKRGAHALALPLFAIIELGKHATAPDVDRDGVFTPGVDENEYRERAKIWGVRDVIGTINNQLLAFDNTMSIPRRRQDSVAPVSATTRFPGAADLVPHASCRLEPISPVGPAAKRSVFRLSDWMILPPCHETTRECAMRHVTEHPDFLDLRTILKEWAFPASFLRATYGVGPRRSARTLGLGYAMDLDHVPGLGKLLPLPGRIGADAFIWRQNRSDPDAESCFADCSHRTGVGWSLRYEQFLSNLFGIFSATRVYSPPVHDAWFTFGPFVEAPLGRHSNVSVEGGLAFRPYSSPRFEIRIGAGLWKPKTNHVGVRAGSDHQR